MFFILIAIAGGEAPRPKGVVSFREAYRRERSELRAERDALKETLEELSKKRGEQKQKLEEAIRDFQTTGVRLGRTADELEGRVRALRRRVESVDDNGDLVDATLESGARTVEKLGEGSVDGQTRAEKVSDLFDRGARLMGRLSTVHEVDGTFFDEEGREVEGTIVYVGGVAALGFSASGGRGGVLARDGDGGPFVVIDGSAAAVEGARRLAGGERVASVPVHLFTAGEPAARSPRERSWLEMIRAGGVIAWIILALAGFALLVILERIITLGAASHRSRQLGDRVLRLVSEGRARDAEEIARGSTPLARTLSAVLTQRGRSRDELDELGAEAILKERPRLERLFSALGAVAAVAPLLGLLGTVSGMISTFRVITQYGTGDPKLLSGGISEALITTELGLAVAIPVLLAHTLLSRWSDRIVDRLQVSAMSLINLLDGRGSGEKKGARRLAEVKEWRGGKGGERGERRVGEEAKGEAEEEVEAEEEEMEGEEEERSVEAAP